MTLIITALSENSVVQVSDCRLTRTDGSLCDDLAVKAICVSCTDAGFSMAYSGLAEIQNQQTDQWVVEYLISIKASGMRFPELFTLFKERSESTFRTLRHLGPTRAITFVMAGYGSPGPFMAVLSNAEDEKGNLLKNVSDDFHSRLYFRKNKPMQKLGLIIHGVESAVETFKTAIPQIRKRYLRENPQKIAELCVQLIRRAANHPKVGRLIGRNCISVVMKPTGGFLCQDYRENAPPEQQMPHFVGRDQAIWNIKIWTGKKKPPWW
jgi:hypothetical protein